MRTAEYRPAKQRRIYGHDVYTCVDLFCVDDQTEILTTAGWKRYNEVAVGDTALTIRPDGATAEWQPVQAVNVFSAQRRRMQAIEGRGISALTTDNHRWLVRHRTKKYLGGGRTAPRYGSGPSRFEFRRSDQLTVDDAVPMGAPVRNVPKSATVPDALVELVAWYWTEGTDRASGRVHIVQDHIVNPQNVHRIRAALAAQFGPEREKRKRPGGPLWAENRSGSQTTFGLNRAAAAALKLAAPDKVPSIAWLAHLTQRQLDLFIQRSVEADGHERTRPTGRVERVLSQGDHARASAFQAACLIAGYAASMKQYQTTYRHGGTSRLFESWAVTVGMREFVKPIRQKKVGWVEHDGIVWCPTTPNGTWLARRNGTAYFTGNSGFGGLTLGVILAGFTAITAANHNAFKVEVHEANHPEVEHWICDLANPESSDYHSAADLPAADLLVAGITCTNHTIANTQRAYLQGMSLFDMEDPDWEEQATRSERDRATATCVLQYAGKHRPKMILIECTTELQSWGYALPGKRKVGDGTTFQWWLKEHQKLGYKYKILYLNSMFFGVPQSRDRLYIVFWLEHLPTPDLEHRPVAWCVKCDTDVQAVWRWKTGVPPSGQVRYGVQYCYRCPSCHSEVIPGYSPSLFALDLSDLGTRIGDKPLKPFVDKATGETVTSPLAPSTMARADRCLRRFSEFPAVLMPVKATRGVERHPWQPMSTQTSQQETALLSTGAILQMANGFEHPGSECRTRDLAEPLWTQPASNSTGLLTPPVALGVINFQGAPRGGDKPLPAQPGSETLGLLSARILPNRTNGTSRNLGEPGETIVGNAGSGGLGLLSSGVVPFRRHTTPTTHAEAMPTVTADQIPGLLTAAGEGELNGSAELPKPLAYQPDQVPLGGPGSRQAPMLFSGWFKQNGSSGDQTAPHPVLDPFGTLTARDTTTLLSAQWRAALADLRLEDCFFRMFRAYEIGRGCGFDVDFGGHKGSFMVWGSDRAQVDGFGNAVSPPVGEWIGLRLRRALHGSDAA